jgi:hypothetical protein
MPSDPPAGHQTSREFINNDDLAVLDDIIHVPLEEVVRLDCLDDMMGPLPRKVVIQTLDPEKLFAFGHPTFGQINGVVFFVDDGVVTSREILPLYLASISSFSRMRRRFSLGTMRLMA